MLQTKGPARAEAQRWACLASPGIIKAREGQVQADDVRPIDYCKDVDVQFQVKRDTSEVLSEGGNLTLLFKNHFAFWINKSLMRDIFKQFPDKYTVR